jgi:hypothetical protein
VGLGRGTVDAQRFRMRLALLGLALLAACTVTCEDDEESNCRGQCVFEGGFSTQACGEGDGCVECPDLHVPHAGPICSGQTAQGGGLCGFFCDRRFGDCNHLAADGCETELDNDPQNCGSCGAVCHGTCTPAGCLETLSDGEEQPTGLIADHARVYWISRSGGQLLVRTSAGVAAAPQTLAIIDAADGLPATLALLDGALILSTGGRVQVDGGSGELLRVPLDGGTPAAIASGLDGPARIAVDGHTLYWTDFGSGDVMRQMDGGAAEVIVSGRSHPLDIAADAGTVYWLEEGTDGGPAAIFSVVPGGGTVQPLTTPADSPSNLVLNFDGLYWADDAAATFRKRPWQDLTQRLDFTYGQPAPWHVTTAVDGLDAYLFWGDSAAHAIRTAGTCDLVSGEANPAWLALGLNDDPAESNVLDAGLHVFWAEGTRIRRLLTTATHNFGEWCH